LKQENIEQLMNEKPPIAVSLYMPIYGSAEPQAISEDSSRLNSLLHRLKQRLDSEQQYELRHRLDELRELVRSVDFWKYQSGKSIALFVQPHELSVVELPREATE